MSWTSSSRIDALEGLAPLVAVLDAGSFSAAARHLGVPRETLSRQVAALEARLGASLLHRTTRRLTPTVAGSELYARAAPLVREAEAAVAAVQGSDGVPRGRLRVTIPAGGRDAPFGALVTSFLVAYPEIELEVVADNRHVDLVAEGFDVAIRAGTIRDPSLVVRQLGRSSVGVVGSPGYLRAHGTPIEPNDLADHDCLRGLGGGARAVPTWPLWDGGHVAVHGRFSSDNLELLLDLAIGGHGLAPIPNTVARAAITAGHLVSLVPAVGAATQIGAVFPSRAHLDPKVRAFVDHAVTEIARWGF